MKIWIMDISVRNIIRCQFELQGSWQKLLHILKIAFKLKLEFQSLAFCKNDELIPFYYKKRVMQQVTTTDRTHLSEEQIIKSTRGSLKSQGKF